MSNRAPDVRKFLRAAGQRMKAAEFLLANGFHLDSIYLGGYAVECALKSLILKRTPHSLYEGVFNSITRGVIAHNFGFLRARLQRPPLNCSIPDSIAVGFMRVSAWSTNLRYETKAVDEEDARQFLDAAREILAWAMRS